MTAETETKKATGETTAATVTAKANEEKIAERADTVKTQRAKVTGTGMAKEEERGKR
jgi:hypothetical protein